jgi:carboxypeptidase Q
MRTIQRDVWCALLGLGISACAADDGPFAPVPVAATAAPQAAPQATPQAAPSASAEAPAALPPEIEAYRPAVTALLKEGLARGQAYDKLAALCAAAPHRLSGSQGAADAVEWARQQMLADGLENVRLQPCMVPHWERGSVAELRVLEPASAAGERLTILALGGSVATSPEGLQAEVVQVHSWDELDTLGETVRGRLVFYNRPMDPELFQYGAAYGGAVDQRGRGAVEAARRGGVGAIVRSMTTRLDDFPHTGAMRYLPDGPNVPGVAVSTLGAERLAELLEQGPVKLQLSLDSRWLRDAPSANVLGEIVGRELPDEVVVLGGHLDAWDVGQGAQDDGGGVCQAMEALRLMRALDLKPRRTVRCVAFMNEENGGRGGEAYLAEARGALDKHVMAMESDGGVGTPRGFGASVTPEALATLRAIASLLEQAGCGEMEQGGSGADIQGLHDEGGVPVMAFRADGQHYFDLHHSDRDTLDTVWPRHINLGAAAMAAMAYVVADMESPLPREVPADAAAAR